VSLTSHKQSGRGGERSLHTGGVLSEVRSLLRPPRFHSWALLRDLKTTRVLDERTNYRKPRSEGGAGAAGAAGERSRSIIAASIAARNSLASFKLRRMNGSSVSFAKVINRTQCSQLT
jgi:hypothetical protein